ncbi:MAG: amidohydrolase family protein [Alphaproteobacteria bacterium]|jgi:aminocarboxymuconate-semialdehyde decarboxylase|nr:amidohydrolase family protein [Alphaproteobacteria bacterium]MDP6270122.1 amidohydrolase family protein [Alphaproteobacteria bacterium]
MTVIDVHTHMLNDEWLARIKQHGGPHYSVKEFKGQQVVHMDGAPFMTLQDGMFDYDLRIKNMDQARVDLAIVSLTCPSVYWGDEAVSAESARLMNHDMAAQQTAYPDRIRWFATLPWQYPKAAVAELERSVAAGSAGVFVTANVREMSLTDKTLAPIWQAIDDRALPVLVHPAAPPGVGAMDMFSYNLVASVGFTFDTTLAVSRMIFDGFFERYQKLRIIACHGGGYLPYLAGRLDICYDNMPSTREHIDRAPSTYLPQLYYDSVVFSQGALELCLNVAGSENVLYGSDYPHNIGDMRGCLLRVDSLPADSRFKVRGRNAERVFGL